ncbi:hypothetical protein K504DRAFT_121451 [Pleomassaria siparia CBS 279.74]|uniref:Ubiquitin carrier protein n=1 Tax=Pleomassaria siparia CBS 279.74 TaxID=1314801 RepID=A0A6G1JVI9_9PLEO|nr:hypothetical protein K504DRAFT_121451 [Pleomassaria siparia CBS 279.74]
MIEHVVRRGLEHPSTVAFIKRTVAEGPDVEIPAWGISTLGVTFWAIFVFVIMVDYSLKNVVATLAMVETPSAAITISAAQTEAGSKDDKQGLLETGNTITLVHQKPITSGIRATLRHLVSLAGAWSRVRGILAYFLYAFCFSFVSNVFVGLLPKVSGSIILAVAASGALLANLHASWTHKVIAMPTDKCFHKRIPARAEWKVLALPAAVQAAMPYISLYIITGFGYLLFGANVRQENYTNLNAGEWIWLIVRCIMMVFVALACTIFICLPAMVTQIRVEASILPEDQDTIVPFDRTFNGKVVPKILGGSGSIGFMDAWRSFNWEARIRLIKVYVKVFFIITAMLLTFGVVMLLEAMAIMGPAFAKAIKNAQA